MQKISILIVLSGISLLTGCHTFEGTIKGADEDYHMLRREPANQNQKNQNTEKKTQMNPAREPDYSNKNPSTPASTSASSATNIIPVTNQPTSASQPINTPASSSNPSQNKPDEPEIRSTPNPE